MTRKLAFASLALAASLSLSACGKHDEAQNVVTENDTVINDEVSIDSNAVDSNTLGPDGALDNAADAGTLGNEATGNGATAP